MTADQYLLDNARRQAAGRFRALSALFDEVTRRHVAALGIRPGRRCWEVGAGGASVPAWLAAQVGPAGHVLATDIDPSWLEAEAPDGVEVRRQDVARDEPPEGAFHLVHARLVLVHVPEREEALRRMVAALRPGGHLLVEDFDVDLQPLVCPGGSDPEHARAERIRTGFIALLVARGVDRRFGRKLPAVMRALGLVGVRADACFPITDPAGAALDAANVEQVREGLIAQGHASAEEIDVCVPPLVSASGRRG